MKDALKKVFSEELISFKETAEDSKEMMIRRKILMNLMDYIHETFILDNVPAKAMKARGELKKISFSKEKAIETLDELECLMNRLY